MQKVTIVGCGDIGERVAKFLLAEGLSLDVLVRSASRAEYLKTIDLNAIQLDLDQDDLLKLGVRNSAVIWFAPPPSSGCEDHRVRRWIDILSSDALPNKIVYISTSGVYGDCKGAWIDESSAINPQADRSKRRADAEQQIISFCEQHQLPYVILRVAGIYGEGRWPLERIKRGDPVVIKSEAAFSNRIHQDDLAQVCIASLLRDEVQGVINVSDGQQSTMTDYFQQIAEAFSFPPLPEITLAEAKQQLSPAMLTYLMESRRIDNRKMIELLEVLNITLKYPTLEDALGACPRIERSTAKA